MPPSFKKAELSATTSHLVVLAHGIDGDSSDLFAIRDEILGKAVKGLECWQTSANHGAVTHTGVLACANLLWDALRSPLEGLCSARQNSGASNKLRISFIGHAMGGLILRVVAAKVHATGLSVDLDTLLCISSPHLGCRQLGKGGAGGIAPLMNFQGWGHSIMRAGLRLIKGDTGPDLLLDNDTLALITDEKHCLALRAFRRRINVCNGSEDFVVNCESASLLSAEEAAAVVPVSIAACRRPGAGVLWRPSEEEGDALLARGRAATRSPGEAAFSLRANAASNDPRAAEAAAKAAAFAAAWGGEAMIRDTRERTMLLSPLGDSWNPRETTKAQTTWDDFGARRGIMAADILKRMRAVGDWELHLTHFFERSSMAAGGISSPHVDITNGREVLQHLALLMIDAGTVSAAEEIV